MNILVTGCAGFIGFHLCESLLKKKNINVFGIDNINNYYDVKLKIDRLKILKKNKKFKFNKVNINNTQKIKEIFKKNKYDKVVHLAAQAGVRYSISNPEKYLKSNIDGFFNILENSRINKIKHFIFASSSSVYGANDDFPLKEKFSTSKPISFYAATKKSNEVLAYAYSSIYKMNCTGMRFFTVYGPYGRPDMSLFLFTDSIVKSKNIYLHNNGNHMRDFTYIDDTIDAINLIINRKINKDNGYKIYNIGSNNPKSLRQFLNVIEKNLKIKSKIVMKSLQKGDVYKTHASINLIYKELGFKTKTSLDIGVKKFIKWYKSYYKIQ